MRRILGAQRFAILFLSFMFFFRQLRSCFDVTINAISEGVRGYALVPKNAEALWKKSEELVGESF